MNAFINLDRDVFSSVESTIGAAKKAGWICCAVSDSPNNKEDFMAKELCSFYSGDIIAIMHGFLDGQMAYVSSDVDLIPQCSSGNQVLSAGNPAPSIDALVSCVVGLRLKARMSKYLSGRLKSICATKCLVASDKFWHHVCLIHTRMYGKRLVIPNQFYHDMLINFSIALYDYDVVTF